MNDMSRSDQAIAFRTVENLTTAVVALDANLSLAYINPAGESLFDVSARKAHGMPISELLPSYPEIHSSLEQALRSNRSFSERELQLELTGKRHVTVDCIVTPMVEPGEAPMLLVEWLLLDRHLRISREEHLIVQHHATSELIRGVAHEVKNPLGGLRGAAQLLERELESDELKEYTQIIIAEADRLKNLADRMLGPNQLPKLAEVNIHEVLERVRQLVRVEAPSGIKLTIDYDPSLPNLIGDNDQLVQAVLNIVRNAVQALGDTGTITLRTRIQRQFTIGHTRHNLVIRLDIIDDGPGISAELQERIFYPMVTGRADGTGLGLSIAQSLINQHHGLIECTSEPGNTVFTLLLPLEPEHE